MEASGKSRDETRGAPVRSHRMISAEGGEAGLCQTVWVPLVGSGSRMNRELAGSWAGGAGELAIWSALRRAASLPWPEAWRARSAKRCVCGSPTAGAGKGNLRVQLIFRLMMSVLGEASAGIRWAGTRPCMACSRAVSIARCGCGICCGERNCAFCRTM